MTTLASTSKLQKPSSKTLSWGALILCFALALLVPPKSATAGNWNVAVGVSGGNGYRPIAYGPGYGAPFGPGFAEATGVVAHTDMVVGEVVGMEVGLLGGDILRIQLATHTHLAHHQQSMCSRFWLSLLCWQHKPSRQSGIFAHPPRSIFRM